MYGDQARECPCGYKKVEGTNIFCPHRIRIARLTHCPLLSTEQRFPMFNKTWKCFCQKQMFNHLVTSANKIGLIKWKKVADYGDHVIDISHNFNMHKTLTVRSWAEHWSNLRRSKEGERPQANMWTLLTLDGGKRGKKGKKGRKQKRKENNANKSKINLCWVLLTKVYLKDSLRDALR